MNYDVAVLGAGAAGIAAAIAAAESGAKVIIVERYGFTGGLATSAMVGTICGLYYRSDNGPFYAVRGFAKTFSTNLQAKCHTRPVMYSEGLYFLPYQPSAFHQQAIEMLQQAGVTIMLHSYVSKVTVSGDKIDKIYLQSAGSTVCLSADAVVDCTGNAHISMLAGVHRIEQAHYQSGAFVFQVAGLPQMDPRVLALNLLRWIKRGIHSADLDVQSDRLSVVPGTYNKGMSLLKLGLSTPYDGTVACLSLYEIEARKRSMAIVSYLRDNVPELKNLVITTMATEVGIRTMSRAQGIETLNETTVLDCVKPEDGIAIGAWPIELWGNERQPEMAYFAMHDYYLISARTLVSKYLHNLFFAGRAISATERAIASARVIGTCLSTGYATGMLAAEYTQEDTWQSAVEKIRVQQVYS